MAILALPAPRLTSHEMKVSIRSALSELGDVTNPNWPSRETLERYDDMNRSDFWRSRGASPEAVALLSLGGIDDRVETWSALSCCATRRSINSSPGTTKSAVGLTFCLVRVSPVAGAHTSVWIDGWMQGALESGNRVAREINTRV